jgi:transcriptional regulator with XRE-family HTH domain/tetratricopeptide (TPR) repeat protein
MERASLSVDWLADARRAHGWTQEDIAEKVDVDIRTVQRWERGKTRPQPPKYRQLEALFDRGPKPVQTKPLDASVVPAQAELDLPNASMVPKQEARPALIVVTPSVAVVRDTYTKFVAWDLGIRLDRIVRTWSICRGNARYHELQTLLIREIELKDNTMQETPMNRRNALRRLASVPIELWGLTLAVPIILKPFPFDDILHQCAAGITALWYLHRGKDLAFVDSAVSRYIPTLEEMVKTSSGIQRQESASILAQCLLLKGQSVRHLQANHAISLHYMQQAETASERAGNKALSIAAVRAQAVTYDYSDNWKQAMYAAEKAKHLIETADEEETPISLMLQSYVYAGLANYQAHTGSKYKQDALTSLGQAQTALDAAKDEPVPVWIDPSGSTLLLNSGLAYYHLGDSQQAIETFAKISQLPESTAKINRVESLIDQVMAEVTREDKPRDMAFCIARWKQGIQGAIALRSEQRYAEAKVAYAAMRAAWPTEKRIKALSEYMKHW